MPADGSYHNTKLFATLITLLNDASPALRSKVFAFLAAIIALMQMIQSARPLSLVGRPESQI